MVDTADLPQVNSLMERYTNYRQAYAVLGDDGRIVSFDVSGTRGFARIAADDISYPSQMLDAIREQVRNRLEDLERDLADLGVEFNGRER